MRIILRNCEFETIFINKMKYCNILNNYFQRFQKQRNILRLMANFVSFPLPKIVSWLDISRRFQLQFNNILVEFTSFLLTNLSTLDYLRSSFVKFLNPGCIWKTIKKIEVIFIYPHAVEKVRFFHSCEYFNSYFPRHKIK